MRGTAEERFWAKVMPEPNTGCWLWLGYQTRGCYGQLRVTGRRVYAHRFAYELCVGAIPMGLEIDHLCRTPACVNPSHLEPVTHIENLRRSPFTLVSIANRKAGYCLQGHKYTVENILLNRGKRYCRACRNVRQRAYRQRRAARMLEMPM